ncbi:hypothetical protein HUN08_12375 [Gordonia sp. X0973]|uniref:hypothetical protein n=1 Tax=Gordonia sp. X0973 TaxID=2742602 RepID=UPI000F549979|nr:hypothetical protein [Gordonia sp. X0973]QKT07891.1 hypothetical protein HUN08_12375 [Gordonia sp. X0973]
MNEDFMTTYYREQAESNKRLADYWEGKLRQHEELFSANRSDYVYIINRSGGDVWGVYSERATADYAYETAPGDCYLPQKKAVLCA